MARDQMELLSTPRVKNVSSWNSLELDIVASSGEGDWAERKELEKNERYRMHIYFINYLSTLNG